MEFKLGGNEYLVGINGYHSSTQVNSMQFRTNTGIPHLHLNAL
jgi:hypothetical protein